jgi:hypothetical protein
MGDLANTEPAPNSDVSTWLAELNPVNAPEFYCHGQACIDGGCSPLLCKDQDPHDDPQPRT